MSDGRDLMTRLPPRLRSRILSVLDAESLLACAAVSRDWDEMTNRLPLYVWYDACLEAGIRVDPRTYRNARQWKAFLSSMTRRLRDMKASTCYQTIVSEIYEQPIKAIYCRNEKIAIAYGDSVDILDATDEFYCVKFECNFDVSILKFDDNILVAASSSGYISCWSIPLENRLRGYAVRGRLFAFDFFTDYSILASSIQRDDSTSNIYLWSMERLYYDGVYKINVGENIIYRLIVAPFRDEIPEHEKVCFLFGLSKDCVLGWIVELIGETRFARSLLVRNVDPLRIPPSPDIHRYGIGLTPYGFLFDGEELYITAPSPDSSPYIIWVWNIMEDTLKSMESYGEILNLLGVGEKYLVYSARYEDHDALYAVHKYSNKLIACVEAPRISEDFICLGHTSWLDGLNGENDCGVVYTATMNEESQLVAVKFAPRTE